MILFIFEEFVVSSMILLADRDPAILHNIIDTAELELMHAITLFIFENAAQSN
jgi:hypothetical protein